MQLNNYLKSKMHLIGAFSLLFGLASCGSYQYVGQDDDGIYGTSERTTEYHEIVENQEEPNAQNSNYYQNYFKQLSEEEMIFTDIDAYEGDYGVENDSLEYQDSYSGWGEDNSDVTINIYGGHAYNSIRWNRRFYPSLYWNYANIYSFNNYWDPFYYGSYWDRPFWRNSYYGNPYYYGYGYNYYHGNYYNGNNYYGNYYNRYYNSRRLAYNSGRRGSLYTNSNIVGLSNRQGVVNRNTSRRSSIQSNSTRSRSTASTNSRRRNNRDVGTTNSRQNVNSRPRSTTTRPRTTTSRSRPTATSRTSNTRARANTTRSRSNNNSSSYRPSTSRSSSNVRSSSSTTRSSSSTRSSGRSSSSRRGNNN